MAKSIPRLPVIEEWMSVEELKMESLQEVRKMKEKILSVDSALS